MDDLHAELLRQPVEASVSDQLPDFLGGVALDLLVREDALADVDQPLFREVRNQAGIRAVFDHGCGTPSIPGRNQPANIHVPPVKRPLSGMPVRRAGVRIPQFGRRVHVEHAMIVAPLQDLAGVDVPCEVDEQVAGRKVFAEPRSQILAGDAIAHETHAPGGPLCQLGRPVPEIHHRDVPRRHPDQLEDDRQCAFRHRAVAHEENSVLERDHDIGRLRCEARSP